MTELLLLSGLLACTGGPSADTGVADSGAPSGWGPFDQDQLRRLLRMSPRPELPDDPTNAVYQDPLAADLGHRLFYDPGLSGSGEFSCATCHDPALGFSSGLMLAEAAGRTTRHAQPILDTAWNRWFFWDGRADSYWAQALGPIEDDNEQDGSRMAVAHHLAGDDTYRSAYEALFGPLPDLSDSSRFPASARPSGDPDDPDQQAWEAMTQADRDTVDTIYANVGKSIAAFERLLVSGDAPLDAYVAAVKADDADAADAALSAQAQAGLALFVGDANCHLCHSGPLLSDLEFHSLQLRWLPGMDEADLGRYDGITRLREDPFNGAGAHSDDPDYGASRIDPLVQGSEHVEAFKTPGLRNVALSPPYMHGGHFADLAEVVDFYDQLDQQGLGSGHRDEILVPLELTEDQKTALVAFLTEALTGPPPDPALLEAP